MTKTFTFISSVTIQKKRQLFKRIVALIFFLLTPTFGSTDPVNSPLKNNLTNKKLCQLSTIKSNNKIIWNENKFALQHVASAKSKGLTCGVEEKSSETITEDSSISFDTKICLLATQNSNGKIIWNRNDFADVHIARAKTKGLTCGTTPDEPEVKVPTNYQTGIEAYNNGDFETAMDQAKLLVPLGNIEAQFHLGKMYADGKGTLQRNTHAHMWFNLASANGHTSGAVERELIAKKMTPSSIERAQDLAAKCMKSNYRDCW